MKNIIKQISIKKIFLVILIILLILPSTILLSACAAGKGTDTGVINHGIINQGFQETCETTSKNGSSVDVNLGESWTKPGGKEGTVVAVPSEYENNCMKFMGYDSEVRGAWYKAHVYPTNSYQYEYACKWWDEGKKEDDQYLTQLQGRYCVAMKVKWGKGGDLVDVKTSDGKVIPCIIVEAKGNENNNEWCHGDGPGDWNFVEFFKDGNKDYSINPGNPGCHPEWSKKVIAICSYGQVEGATDTTKSKNKCEKQGSGGNESIAAAAVTLCYEAQKGNGYTPVDSSKTETVPCTGAGSGCNRTCLKGYDEFRKKLLENQGWVCECSSFVPVAIRWAGADDTFPRYTKDEIAYCNSHPDKWEFIGEGKSKADLKPGDVLVTHSDDNSGPSHIYLYCGSEAVKKLFPNSDCEFAEASLGNSGHGPIISSRSDSDVSKYKVYRNKTPEASSKWKNEKFN